MQAPNYRKKKKLKRLKLSKIELRKIIIKTAKAQQKSSKNLTKLVIRGQNRGRKGNFTAIKRT